MQDYSLTPVLIKWKKNKAETFRVAIRITVGRTSKYINMPFKVSSDDWDEKKHLVAAHHPNAPKMNVIIKNRKKDIEEEILKDIFNETKLSSESIKSKSIDKKSKESFFAFCDNWLHAVEFNLPYADNFKYSTDTLKAMRSELSKLKQYKSKLQFSDIDNNFLSGYLSYMINDLKNCENTQWKTFKALRKFLSVGVNKKIIKINPCKEYINKPKYEDPLRDFLQLDEVDRLLEEVIYKLEETDPVYQVTCWFVLSCMAGFRYGDLVNWDEAKYRRGNRLILRTSKTGQIVSIPMQDDLHDILERVKRIGPIFTDQECNVYVKEAFRIVKIPFAGNFHMSRHTFGASLASSGVAISVAQMLLGHKKIETTKKYYHLTDCRMDEEMAKVSARRKKNSSGDKKDI